MDRQRAHARKLGIIAEGLQKLPRRPDGLTPLEREGVLHVVQVCIDAAMDVVAMMVKDRGVIVSDDYHNLEALKGMGALDEPLAADLRRFNGLRNAIVHRYNKFEERQVWDNLDHIRKALLAFIEAAEVKS